MTIAMIKISDLILSEEVQSRVSLDENVINEYAEAMKNGDEFPPIDVYRDGDDNYVADGFHRVKGAIKAGLTEFKAKIKEGTIRDAILHSVSANSTHGLRRTNLDKRNAVEKLLVDPEWQLWSDRKIADKCAVSPSTVAKVRNDLSVQVGQIQERNFERNGKTHTMNTTNIGAKKEDSPEYLEPDDADEALPISEVLGKNIIKAPVEFKKPPIQKEVPDDPDYPDDEDDEDLEDNDENVIYQVVKKDPEKELKALGLKLQDSLDFLMHWEKHIQPVLDNPIALNGVSPEVIGEMVLLANQNLNRLKEFLPTITEVERR